jgi:DNA helicase HerA-like ATPase/Txe/YoeB family toxin of Txe-Axe toxin-antitoxin module
MHHHESPTKSAPDRLFSAFEHSITWEDDIWRADPVDVAEVHAKARQKFNDLLTAITLGQDAGMQDRILLFHGQSGAGKTHLIRALRTTAHRRGIAYFGYAQLTPDVGNYADYYLRRLVHSLEKPYDPDRPGESALTRLTSRLVADAHEVAHRDLKALREVNIDDAKLATLVLKLADSIVSSPKYVSQELDINVVRALLYLERHDPRIDQRVRQYLHGRDLTDLAHKAVAALDPNVSEDRAFEIIRALGTLMWTVDRAALVFCIDQVEDLRFFADAEERFQRAVRDLIQIANRLPNAILIISCLEDFYGQVRGELAQSYVDRIEKSGPVALLESRTPEEARLIISKRLSHLAKSAQAELGFTDPSAYFGPQFFEEFSGLSTRRLLEHAYTRLRAKTAPEEDELDDVAAIQPTNGNGTGNGNGNGNGSFVSKLAAALGLGFSSPEVAAPIPATLAGAPAETAAPTSINYRDLWTRFESASEAEVPSDERELLDILAGAIGVAKEEWPGAIDLSLERRNVNEDVPVIDLHLRHSNGLDTQARVFLCNRPTQGGGLKRQLDKVLDAMDDMPCFMLRASDFPPNRKNQTAQAFRRFRDNGGRQFLVPIPEWERMMMVREFYTHHRNDPGFPAWFADAKLLSKLSPLTQLMRLDLLGFGPKPPAPKPAATTANGHASSTEILPESEDGTASDQNAPATAEVDELPMSVLLDENGNGTSSILAGRETFAPANPVRLNKNVLKRHAAVLGGSGSGKTTLALCLIEQLLLRGIPAVLLDRKGDLCSYANPDVWRDSDDESPERRAEREKLADSIDVAVYTPGRASGRPISITLLPNGINELPEHEQQLLANLSSAALGEMLHLKNSATHQKQSGTLSVALRILGSRYSREVTLTDLIHLLEDEDPELSDLTQRMDPSGKIRRDLVAQLDSLRFRNAALFEAGGESLSMESLFGLGPFAREGRTRLSIIYTGFLGDNENILFWVSQFLSEALRFCQRNPNDELQSVVMFDEADLYIPANAKPATAEPLQSLLKRARSAGLGIMLATQSPGDLDYKSRDQITSWFIGRVREDTALRKLKAAFQSESGLEPAAVLPMQTVGEFHLVQEGLVRPMKAQRSLITAEQVPFDRIEQLAAETRGKDTPQLKLFER